MARGTWRRLLLLLMWAIVLVHIQYVTTEVRVPCAMVKDWFPSGVEPQTSKPPYVLDVIPPDGKSPYQGELHYGPGEELTYTIFLNGTHSDNGTEMFTGFIIYIYNEFEDEESGHFVKPLPDGVSMKECHFNQTSQWIEYVENSTSTNRSSLQVKWKSPKKYPAGKITIRDKVNLKKPKPKSKSVISSYVPKFILNSKANVLSGITPCQGKYYQTATVVKEEGVYWEGITLTLNHEGSRLGFAVISILLAFLVWFSF